MCSVTLVSPEVSMSDKGPQFDCAEFRAFCDRRNIRAVSSSPTYAQSNGLVERYIQTVKRTILKMFESSKTRWEALAAIRSTPVSSDLLSPAVILQGRHLRGNLPFLPDRLTPQHVPATFVCSYVQLQRRQAMACFHHGGRLGVRVIIPQNWTERQSTHQWFVAIWNHRIRLYSAGLLCCSFG